MFVLQCLLHSSQTSSHGLLRWWGMWHCNDPLLCLRVEVWGVGSQNEIQRVAQRTAVFIQACIGDRGTQISLWLFNSLCLFRAFERCSCCFWPWWLIWILCAEISSVWRNQRQVLGFARNKPLQLWSRRTPVPKGTLECAEFTGWRAKFYRFQPADKPSVCLKSCGLCASLCSCCVSFEAWLEPGAWCCQQLEAELCRGWRGMWALGFQLHGEGVVFGWLGVETRSWRKQEGMRRLSETAVQCLSTWLTSKLLVGASLGWIFSNSDWDPGLWPSCGLVVFLLSVKVT